MLQKFLSNKGLVWLNFNHVYRKPQTEFVTYFCTCKGDQDSVKKRDKKRPMVYPNDIIQNNKDNECEKKELPEEPTTCCMSGCANCVWLEYAEKMSEYFKDGGQSAIKEINEKVNDPNIRAFLLQELRMRKL